MRQVTLQEIGDIASASRDALYEDARSVGYNAPKIYLHWTAGHYDTLFEDYHISITGDGEIYVSTDDFSEVLEHTWKRKTIRNFYAVKITANAKTYIVLYSSSLPSLDYHKNLIYIITSIEQIKKKKRF